MRFLRDIRAVSAIEFAIIAPALIIALVGVSEVGRAVTLWRKVNLVADTEASLTAAKKGNTVAELEDNRAAGNFIMDGMQHGQVLMTVTSIVMDSADPPQPKVAWSYGDAPMAPGSTATVPTGLIPGPGHSIIKSEASMDFVPILASSIFNPGTFTISATSWERPHKSMTVGLAQ